MTKVEQQVEETTDHRDSLGRVYATGKRKNSIARVWIKPGTGKISINKKDIAAYFGRMTLQMILKQPLVVTDSVDTMDIMATATGGGLSGQAGAIRHGISKALALLDASLRLTLRAGDFLTRDSRVVERKKFGHKKARKSFQFSKR